MWRERLLAMALGMLAACKPSLQPPDFGAGFRDVTPTAAPLSVAPFDPMRSPVLTWGLVADLAGHGEMRVLLVEAVSPALVRAYRWDGSALVTDDSFTLGGPGTTPPAPAALLDVDGDRLPDALFEPHGGLVAWNRGGQLDTPAPLAATVGMEVNGSPGIVVWDLDDDGWLDVLVTGSPCDSGAPALRVLMATGHHQFVDRSDLVQPSPRIIDQALGVGLLTDGTPLIEVLGSGCGGAGGLPVHFRRSARGADGYPRFEPVDLLAGLDFSLLSPMGAAEADLDGDGLLDHVESLNPRHLVLQGRPDGSMSDRSDDTGFAEVESSRGPSMIPWGVAALDLDRDGATDLVFTHGNDDSAWIHDRIGAQRVGAEWNGGNFRFADVSGALHLDREGQFTSLTVTDLDADGEPDLIAGGSQEPPRVYHNEIAGGRGVSIRLRGTTSNPLGLGARLTLATSDGWKRHAICGSQIGTNVMSEPLVFFGMGQSDTGTLTIDWPSGAIQVAEVAAGRLVTVEEPSLLAIDPPSRRVPADGRSVITVTLDPSLGSAVEIQVDGRAIVGAAGNTGYVARVMAPGTPGSSVMTVTVNGTAMGVRPRLFWN